METPARILAAGTHLRFMARGEWEYADRPGITGIVGMAAVTDAGRLLLVEQFRPPVNCNVIELPAGLVGDSPERRDEDLLAAARRELLEETGYDAGRMRIVAVGPVSAGICSEILTLIYATQLSKLDQGGGIEGEKIIVHEIPLADVPRRLGEFTAAGKLADVKIYSALYFAAQARKQML